MAHSTEWWEHQERYWQGRPIEAENVAKGAALVEAALAESDEAWLPPIET